MNQYNSNPFSWMKQKFCQSPQIWDPKISRRAIRNSIWYCFIRQISWTSRVRLSSRRFGNFVRFLTSRLWRNLQGEVRSGSATSSPSCRQKMGSQLSMICGNYVTMYGYVFVWVFLPNKFQVPKNAWNFWQFTSKIIISLRFQILFFPQKIFGKKFGKNRSRYWAVMTTTRWFCSLDMMTSDDVVFWKASILVEIHLYFTEAWLWKDTGIQNHSDCIHHSESRINGEKATPKYGG